MSIITWQGRALACAPGETVLDCLLRAGVPAASSCRTGACQTCVLRAARGRPPEASQKGLKETWRAQGLFLACQCVPEEDIEVAPADALPSADVTVRRIERHAAAVARIYLECASPFDYRAGQFIHLSRGDGLTRSYSLASVSGEDPLLEIHVKRVPSGAMSGFLHEALRPGDTLTVRGPAGDCFYVEGRPDQPLVLAGTGTGLAPLLGIARDALARGHRGPIRLHHGASARGGLYADAELRDLARRHPAFEYAPCVRDSDGEESGPPVTVGSIDEAVLAVIRERRGCRVFLCGPPERVLGLRKAVFLAGVSMRDIHADAFIMAPPPRP
jgi:ferredoxin-NADP reductase